MQDEPLSGQWPIHTSPLRPSIWLLLCLALLALSLHWWLLGDCGQGACGRPLNAPKVTAVQFRTVSVSSVHPDVAPKVAVVASPRPTQPLAKPSSESAVVEAPKPPRPHPALAAESSPVRLALASGLSPEPLFELAALTQAETASAPAQSKPEVQALPVPESDAAAYRVAVPPGFSATYAFRRGTLSGTAELIWAPADDGHYLLRMHARKGFISVMTQTSQGRLEPGGLEPERMVDSRLGRTSQAANFQRDKGIISFSGPAQTYAWQAGTQDRLSWMVQLPAILAAQAPTLSPGQRFAMTVVGVRGEADVWAFQFTGWETVTTPSGLVRSARLMREARRPHDQQVEIWLDPEKHYQPVRARWSAEQDAQSVELLRD